MIAFEELPKSWKQVPLGEISYSIQYGLNEKSTDDENGILYLRITDIDGDGNLRLIKPKFISADTPQISNYMVEPGDLLIARSGSVGLSYVHLDFDKPLVYASYLILQRKVGFQSGQTNKFRLTMGAISLMVALLVIANAV